MHLAFPILLKVLSLKLRMFLEVAFVAERCPLIISIYFRSDSNPAIVLAIEDGLYFHFSSIPEYIEPCGLVHYHLDRLYHLQTSQLIHGEKAPNFLLIPRRIFEH